MARVIPIKDQKAKTINQNWVWKEFDFDKVFGSKPCLICMTHHPTQVAQSAPKPVGVIVPNTYEDKFGTNDCNTM